MFIMNFSNKIITVHLQNRHLTSSTHKNQI